MVSKIKDWNLFLTFLVADNTTKGKDHKPIRWFLDVMLGEPWLARINVIPEDVERYQNL